MAVLLRRFNARGTGQAVNDLDDVLSEYDLYCIERESQEEAEQRIKERHAREAEILKRRGEA